ncbi:ExbD/TolR family protein [Jannaschia sp. LMIT008]|uniref:ExbD/TolR family protein n=1 Tax=Jannaschia maritima TaxID=3032585 RepID=UPI002811574E|nr:biopolymer transporter ExbD [Jannaschia sp. LMIT008]
MSFQVPRSNGRAMRFDASLSIVNIVLLLIFFFLATGRLIAPADADLRPAETTELPLAALPDPILTMGADGDLALDGVPVAPELLAAALSELSDGARLHLLVDRDVPAERFVALIGRPALRDLDLQLVTLDRAPR